MEWKTLILKKHSENSRSSLFLQQKTLKWKEIQKSYTENRDCFQNLEDEKFNLWKENHNLQNIPISKIIRLASVTVLTD